MDRDGCVESGGAVVGDDSMSRAGDISVLAEESGGVIV